MLKKAAVKHMLWILGALVLTLFSSGCTGQEPLIITESGAYRKLSIDDKINEAEIIVIGEVKTVLPSRWDSPDGKGPNVITPQSIFEADLSIFTDSLISVEQVLKGDVKDQAVIRVRSYSGEVDNVKWEDDSQPAFENGQTFLLFLKENTGPTKNVDPGAYMSINGISAIYTISGDTAASIDDTWVVSELIAYIENSMSN